MSDSHTFTVKFVDRVPPPTALHRLRTCIAAVELDAAVEAVFPEASDPELESLFTVELEAAPHEARRMMDTLKRVDGVEYVEIAPERRI